MSTSILVVDDDQTLRSLIQELLEAEAHTVFTRLRSGKARYRIVLEADFEEVNMRISDQQ